MEDGPWLPRMCSGSYTPSSGRLSRTNERSEDMQSSDRGRVQGSWTRVATSVHSPVRDAVEGFAYTDASECRLKGGGGRGVVVVGRGSGEVVVQWYSGTVVLWYRV